MKVKRALPRKPFKIDDDALRADVEKYPDDYQHESAISFLCSALSIGEALRRWGITIKKTLHHPQAKEPLKSTFTRALDQLQQKHPIVYLDESRFKSHVSFHKEIVNGKYL
ncbi:IS630 transposase-related protein [Acinetobacter nectaris]|uniref:IS630 transposase-related protein n=1 Tax=Acinetobacter nectaris TaxID=1219382 RepID=UPI001F2C719D